MANVVFVVRHPGVPRVIFNALQLPDDTPLKNSVRGILERYRQLLMRLLGAAESRGLIASGIDKAAAGMLFIGAVQGLIMQSMLVRDNGRMSADAERVFALYRNAIRSTS